MKFNTIKRKEWIMQPNEAFGACFDKLRKNLTGCSEEMKDLEKMYVEKLEENEKVVSYRFECLIEHMKNFLEIYDEQEEVADKLTKLKCKLAMQKEEKNV